MAARLHTTYAVVAFVFLLMPLLLAVPLSLTASDLMLFPPRGVTLDWYGDFLTNPRWNGPILVSLALAAVSATLATLIGGLAAWPLARRRFRGRDSVALLLGAPLVVPAISVAVGAYLVWANLRMLGSPISLVATHVVLTCPLVLLVVGAALLDFDETYVHAARTLGAGRWTILRRIVVPQILPSLIASWLFAFIGSFDEVVITNFLLTAGQVPTLAVYVFNQIDSSASPAIAASAVVMATIAVVFAIAVTHLDARRRAA
jgi:ABC-type spermidine/putrescine transport system permease subunit II